MKNLMLGILLGSCLTAGLGIAGDYYNSNGGLSAPNGSQHGLLPAASAVHRHQCDAQAERRAAASRPDESLREVVRKAKRGSIH